MEILLLHERLSIFSEQVHLRELRRRYRRAGWLWLLSDRASAHTAPQTQALAARLRIRFVWLPRQAPELSPMDQKLWGYGEDSASSPAEPAKGAPHAPVP